MPLRGATASAPLLGNVMRSGKRNAAPELAAVIRQRAHASIVALAPRYRRLVTPARYQVGITLALAALKADLIAKG